MSLSYDLPIIVWILSLNREYTKDEYDRCHKLVAECVDYIKVPYNPRDPDSFRMLMTLMLPLLMMRHRRIPRSRWKDCVSPTGKHWIEAAADDMTPERFLHSMIGYHSLFEGSMCAMAMTQGSQRRVINIGMGVKQYTVEPKGVSVAAYIESLHHKLTPLEISGINEPEEDDRKLRRLCIVLSLKQAYIKAIGQPIGFDYSRLEFNVSNESAIGDGHPLQGWEFRIWRVHLGVARRDKIVSEFYECAIAFFRGSKESTFIWHDEKDLDTWVQFINIDQMVKVIPKLNA